MNARYSSMLLGAAALLSASAPATADIILAVDLSSGGGTAIVESDFVSLVSPGAATVGETFSTAEAIVNATIGATGGGGFLAGRDGSANDRGGDLSNLTQQDLHGDLVAARGGDGGFTIQLTGLGVGDEITITAWHNEANGGNSGFATPGALVTPSIVAGATLISATDGAHSNFSRPDSATYSGPYEDSDLIPSVISFTTTSSTVDLLLSSAAANGFNPVSGFTVDGPALPPPPPGPDSGILLAVDLSAGGGNGGTANVETDFVSLTAPATAAVGETFSTSETDVNASISATGAAGFLAGRDGSGNDRGGDLSNLTQGNLHGELIAARGGDGGFTIQLTGLPLGKTIILTTWHNDANGGNSGFATVGASVTPSITTGGTLISATNGAHSNLSRPDATTYSGPYTDADLAPSVISFTATETSADILLQSGAENLFLPVSGFTVEVPVAANVPVLVITQDGVNLDFSWASESGLQYDLVSTTDLTAPSATWSVVGTNENIPADPSGTNTLSILRPADPARFYALAVEEAPPVILLDADFETDNGGFTFVDYSAGAGTAWEWGAPDSDNTLGSAVTAGNGSSTKGWATDLGDFSGTDDNGYYNASTDGALSTPAIDLTTATSATLSYAQAVDIAAVDTAVVNFLDVDDSDNIVASMTVTDSDLNASPWKPVSFEIPAAALGKNIRIEWRLTTTQTADYIGWYIDDVLIVD